LQPEEALYRERGKEETFPWDVIYQTFPWDVIYHGIEKSYLWNEYLRGLSARTTPPCDVGMCTRCGVCV
jgi:hypothetical protein